MKGHMLMAQCLSYCLTQEETGSGHLVTTKNKQEDRSPGLLGTAKGWKEFDSLMTSLSTLHLYQKWPPSGLPDT